MKFYSIDNIYTSVESLHFFVYAILVNQKAMADQAVCLIKS